MPGRINGCRCGRKIIPGGGIWLGDGEVGTESVREMPGRINGRGCGRKFFPGGGIWLSDAEVE